MGSKVLFKGQRKSRKSRECETCGRPICKGEYYFTVVRIHIYDGTRNIEHKQSCCKELS